MSVEIRQQNHISEKDSLDSRLLPINQVKDSLDVLPSTQAADFIAAYRPVSSIRNFEKVRSPLGMGVYASANENFAAAHFTRDSVKASSDTLDIRPEIAAGTIVTGLEFQATADNKVRDGKTGEIHHEHRDQNIIATSHLTPEVVESAAEILAKLAGMWGGDGQEVTYYGGKDTTPELIILVMKYQRMYPDEDILSKTPKDFVEKGRPIQRAERQDVTVRDSMVSAVSSVVKGLVDSDLALREFEMKNPRGIQNKYWKDSSTSLLFTDGQSVNHQSPIAEIGIQGLTYDTLKLTSQTLSAEDIERIVKREDIDALLGKESVNSLFSEDEITTLYERLDTGEINGLDILAKVVQQQTLTRFWLPDSQNQESGYFGSAIDRDPNDPTGQSLRLVDTPASNAGLLLKSTLFDDLSDADREKYVSGIAQTLMSDEFLTDVGIRGRAKQYFDLVPFSDYHGSGTSWLKETDDIAQGFRHQGLHQLADQLEYRLINAVNISGSHYEFFYVDKDGKVNFDPHGKRSDASNVVTEKRVIYGTNIPEPDQAWSISASIRSKREQGKLVKQVTTPGSWQETLERNLLLNIPHVVELLKTHKEIQEAFPHEYSYTIDTVRGRELDQIYNTTFWSKNEKKAA